MNVSLSSQLESPLLTDLQSAIITKPFSYSLTKNFPLVAKSSVRVSSNTTPSGSVYGKNLSFKVPKYGLVSGMMLKYNITSTVDASAASLPRLTTIGSRFAANTSLRAHNRVIQDNDFDYIENRIANSSDELQVAYTNMTTSDVAIPVSGGTLATHEFMCPLFFYFGERTENYLDLEFCEPLEVSVEINSRTAMWGTTETDIDFSFNSVELVVYYVNQTQEVASALQQSQFRQDEALTMLANDSYRETVLEVAYDDSVDNQVKSAAVTCRSNNVITASHITVRDQDTGVLLPITSVTLASAGRTLVDSTRKENIFENTQMHVHNSIPGSSSAIDKYSVHYGFDSDKTYFSGGQAFDGLSAPIYTIVCDLTGYSADTTLEFRVQHDYLTLISISSNSGAVSRSLAN